MFIPVPGSEFSIPDPGSRVKKIRIPDPGSKVFGSRIQGQKDSDPGSATLVKRLPVPYLYDGSLQHEEHTLRKTKIKK
jgi:hypothetical protein